MATETLDAARRYVAAGLSVIPILRGSKQPHHVLLERTTGLKDAWVTSDSRSPWRVYCGRLPTDEELVTWFAEGDAGVGIVGGAVSGGLVRIDFEHRACLSAWQADLGRIDPTLAQIAAALPVSTTGKGHHVYLRMPDPPSYVLLSSFGTGNDTLVLAETQGEGCYCMAPPSMGYRPDGMPFQYAWAAAPRVSFAAIPTFNQELATALLEAARFSAFWQPEIADSSFIPRIGRLHRSGLSVGERRDQAPELWFSWEHLRSLRAYLERYDPLLRAVETAPPPPPSYNESEDEEQEDDDY